MEPVDGPLQLLGVDRGQHQVSQAHQQRRALRRRDAAQAPADRASAAGLLAAAAVPQQQRDAALPHPPRELLAWPRASPSLRRPSLHFV